VRRLERDDATPVVAFAHVELHALPRLGDEALENWPGTLGKRELSLGCGGESTEGEAEHITTVVVAAHQTVSLESGSQAVTGGSRQAGRLLEFAEGETIDRRRKGIENGDGLVQHSDSR
jgi:hypothetical protein